MANYKGGSRSKGAWFSLPMSVINGYKLWLFIGGQLQRGVAIKGRAVVSSDVREKWVKIGVFHWWPITKGGRDQRVRGCIFRCP